jgi:hypothetical protein
MLEMLLPEGATRKYGRMVMSLLVLLYIVQAIGNFDVDLTQVRIFSTPPISSDQLDQKFVQQKQWQVESVVKSIPGIVWVKADITLDRQDKYPFPSIRLVRVTASVEGSAGDKGNIAPISPVYIEMGEEPVSGGSGQPETPDKNAISEVVVQSVKSLLSIEDNQVELVLR